MKSCSTPWRCWGLAGLLGVLLLVLSGCGSVERDATHASSRPWNAPKAWEGGLPTSLNEGR